MSNIKKYHWLKLKNDFFSQKEIKKLRKIAGGDTFVIIYLKMQLKSIQSGGILQYEGVEDTFYEEIALDLDEDVENVKVTIAFLINNKLLEQISEEEYFLSKVPDLIGSETDSAERVRKHRENKKLKENILLQCNADVTKCNTEIEIEIEDRKIDNKNNNLYNIQLQKLKLVEGSLYEPIFNKLGIIASKYLPEEHLNSLRLYQNAVKRLIDSKQLEVLDKISLITLDKIRLQVESAVASGTVIDNIVRYFTNSVINEFEKRG